MNRTHSNQSDPKPYYALIAFLVSAVVLVTVVLIGGINQMLQVADDYRETDVIVAFSATLLNNCEAHPNAFRREAFAARMLQRGYSRSQKLIISGTYTQPPHSVAACQTKLARQFEIPAHSLIIENQAKTTYENAQNVSQIMKKNGWKTALLVTSQSHMFRAMQTLKKQNVQAYPAQIPDFPPNANAADHSLSLASIQRLLYEYGALAKYLWYGYI